MGHFESAPMTFFTENLVAVNGWLGRTRIEIRLSCGFGPSFIVKDVEEFKPKRDANFHKFSRKTGTLNVEETLPIGIANAKFLAEGRRLDDLELHLDRIISNRNDLDKFAERMLTIKRSNRPSRTLKTVLDWFQAWKDEESGCKPAEGYSRLGGDVR